MLSSEQFVVMLLSEQFCALAIEYKGEIEESRFSVELYFIFVGKHHQLVKACSLLNCILYLWRNVTKWSPEQSRESDRKGERGRIIESFLFVRASKSTCHPFTKIDASRESWSCLTIEGYKRLWQFQIKHKTRIQIKQCNKLVGSDPILKYKRIKNMKASVCWVHCTAASKTIRQDERMVLCVQDSKTEQKTK